MKKLLVIIVLLFFFTAGFSQSTLPLRADTVKIEKIGGNGELIIRNATRDSTGGILVNISGGRTAFLRTRQLTDSTFVIGKDTITIRGTGSSLIKSAGSAYKLVLPPDSVRSINIAGTWLFGDTTTDRKELRLGVDPQVGYGINIAPVTDVLSIDTTGAFSLVPQERLRDTAAAIRAAIGSGNVSSPSIDSLRPYVGFSPAVSLTSTWNAFGNSIAEGASASTTGNRFVNIIATTTGTTVNNVGQGGATIRNIVNKMDTLEEYVNPSRAALIEIGTNDVRNISGSNTVRYVQLAEGLRAGIANHFLDSIRAIDHASITKTGTWSNLSASNLVSKSLYKALGNPMKSSTDGDKLTFTHSGDMLAIFYYGVDYTHDHGSFQVKVDGVVKATVTTKGKVSDYIYTGIRDFDFRSPCVIIIPNLKLGVHSVEIELLENKEVGFDCIGRLGTVETRNPVVVGHILKSNAAGYALLSSNSSDLVVDTANNYIDTVVNFFQHYKYPVALARMNSYDSTTYFSGTDGLHPNNTGHAGMAADYLRVITVPTAVTAAGSTGNVQFKAAGGGLDASAGFSFNGNTLSVSNSVTADVISLNNGSNAFSTVGINLSGLPVASFGAAGSGGGPFAGTMFYNAINRPLTFFRTNADATVNTKMLEFTTDGISKFSKSGGFGVMGYPYETSVFTNTGDTKVGIYTQNVNPGEAGASLMLGNNSYTMANGKYPAFDLQHNFNSTAANNYWSLHWVDRNFDGTVSNYLLNMLRVSGTGQISTPYITRSSTPLDSAVHIAPTGEWTVRPVPTSSLSGSGTSGQLALWNGTSSFTGNSNILWGTSNGPRISIGTTNTQGVLNLGGNKDLTSSGIQSYFATATYTNTTTAASGTASGATINYIAGPTIAATNTDVTFPTIVTLGVDAPTAGTNATITRAFAFQTGTNGHANIQGNLEVDGAFMAGGAQYNAVTTITSTGTLATNVYWVEVNATSGNITITLPAASSVFTGARGIVYKLARVDASGNTVTVQRAGSDTIGAAGTSFSLNTADEVKTLQCVANDKWRVY